MFIEGGDANDVSLFRRFDPSQKDPAEEMTESEKYDKRFWQEGVAGNCNIVCFDGSDISPIAFIQNVDMRRRLINNHNRTIRELIKQSRDKVE